MPDSDPVPTVGRGRGAATTTTLVLPDSDPVPTVGRKWGAATTQTHETNKHPPRVRASLAGTPWAGQGAATTTTFVFPDSEPVPTPLFVVPDSDPVPMVGQTSRIQGFR